MQQETQADGAPSAVEQRFVAHYPKLKSMARARLRQHRSFTLLDTTALVHESFLKCAQVPGLLPADEPAFLAYAGRVMRSVIVDAARARLAQSRGEGQKPESLDDDCWDAVAAHTPAQAIVDVHEALLALEHTDPRLAQVMALQYFVDLPDAEIAKALGVTDRTVRRDAQRARLMLRALLAG